MVPIGTTPSDQLIITSQDRGKASNALDLLLLMLMPMMLMPMNADG
jgi:hypothetical protein